MRVKGYPAVVNLNRTMNETPSNFSLVCGYVTMLTTSFMFLFMYLKKNPHIF